MNRINRAKLRGIPLEPYCKEANTTTNEFGKEDKRVYCFGLYDNNFPNRLGDFICDECKNCKAFIDNITPLDLKDKEIL